MKWCLFIVRGEAFPPRGARVSGTFQTHGGSEGATEHSREIPGAARRRIWRQARHRSQWTWRPRRVPRTELQRTLRSRGSSAAARSFPARLSVPISLEGAGRDFRSAGANPDPSSDLRQSESLTKDALIIGMQE